MKNNKNESLIRKLDILCCYLVELNKHGKYDSVIDYSQEDDKFILIRLSKLHYVIDKKKASYNYIKRILKLDYLCMCETMNEDPQDFEHGNHAQKHIESYCETLLKIPTIGIKHIDA